MVTLDSVVLALNRILAKETHAARWEALEFVAACRLWIALRERHSGLTPELVKLRELLQPLAATLATIEGTYALGFAREQLVTGLKRLAEVAAPLVENIERPDSLPHIEIRVADIVHVEDTATDIVVPGSDPTAPPFRFGEIPEVNTCQRCGSERLCRYERTQNEIVCLTCLDEDYRRGRLFSRAPARLLRAAHPSAPPSGGPAPGTPPAGAPTTNDEPSGSFTLAGLIGPHRLSRIESDVWDDTDRVVRSWIGKSPAELAAEHAALAPATWTGEIR